MEEGAKSFLSSKIEEEEVDSAFMHFLCRERDLGSLDVIVSLLCAALVSVTLLDDTHTLSSPLAGWFVFYGDHHSGIPRSRVGFANFFFPRTE